MRIHPWFDDPAAVLVSRSPVPNEPTDIDFRQAAIQALTALEVETTGARIVIKPNVTSGEMFADPDSGITTHPQFVQGIVEYFLGHGARRGRVTILEDPRDTDDDEPRHWRGTGYPEVAAETGAVLRCPTSYTCVRKTVPDPHAFSELKVSRAAVDPQAVLINVPKFKAHNLAITTLCMKNLMGAVKTADRHYCRQAWLEIPEAVREAPRGDAFDRALHEQWQAGLARRLIDTAQVLVPRLNLVEGVVGRDGTGFRNGTNYPLGLAIAGTNVVAVDAVATYLMGLDPSSIVYLRMAAEAGLGPNTIDGIRVYVVEDGALAPCRNLERLRAETPFRVISRLPGQEKTPI
jgi:uncharacterized protein (DUF362 family)